MKWTREEYEIFLRRKLAEEGELTLENLMECGFSIKECDCDFESCHGWVFTADEAGSLDRLLNLAWRRK